MREPLCGPYPGLGLPFPSWGQMVVQGPPQVSEPEHEPSLLTHALWAATHCGQCARSITGTLPLHGERGLVIMPAATQLTGTEIRQDLPDGEDPNMSESMNLPPHRGAWSEWPSGQCCPAS